MLPAVAFAVFGSSRHLVVGGDSATAAILFAGVGGLGVAGLQPGTNEWLAYASLAALITGGLLLVARIARLGFLADFISRTVLVGFLTGVGVQVAMGQLAGMLGVASPKVDPNQVSGTLIKFWDTLKEIGDTSLATLAVSLAVIVTLVVFEKWIKAIPGGLVAVVGAITISWAFDLESHGVSVLGKVPSGFPSVGLPSGVGRHDVVPLLATSVSMFLVILAQSAATSRAYAVKYQDPFDENTDLIGLALANVAAGLSSTFVVNGSPTKTEMADEAQRIADRNEIERGLAGIERATDVREGDVGDRQVQIRDRGDQNQREQHQFLVFGRVRRRRGIGGRCHSAAHRATSTSRFAE